MTFPTPKGLWLIVHWDTGERIAWGPWFSWSRFRTAVESWRRERRVVAVHVRSVRPTRVHADTCRAPVAEAAGRPTRRRARRSDGVQHAAFPAVAA